MNEKMARNVQGFTEQVQLYIQHCAQTQQTNEVMQSNYISHIHGGFENTATQSKSCQRYFLGSVVTRRRQLLLRHLFNGHFSRTTWVSQHQKGKPFWILLEQEVMGWQWHQLEHIQIICSSLQTENRASTLLLSFYRPDALPATQPTVLKH